MEYQVLYMSSLALCLIFTAVLFYFHMKVQKTKFFSALVFSYILNMLSLVACILWAPIDGHPEYAAFNYLLNVVDFNCFGFIGYSWYTYCSKYFVNPIWRSPKAKMILMIPVLAVSLLVFTDPITNWLFYVDEAGFYHRGPYFFIQQIGYFYLYLSTALAIISYRKTKFYKQKEHLRVIAFFLLPASLLGAAQLLLPPGALPTIQFSVTLSLFLVFVNDVRQQVTVDNLTKLINRYEFERLLNEKLNHFKSGEGKHIFVLVGDLDNFKAINDKYGHLEGDHALMAVGAALDDLAREHGAVAARMSGDEFYCLVEGEDVDLPMKLVIDVDTVLRELSSHMAFSLAMSVGAVEYNGHESFVELIGRADREMYEVKRKKENASGILIP